MDHTTRKCTKCGKNKPLCNFAQIKGSNSKHYSRCVLCEKIRNDARCAEARARTAENRLARVSAQSLRCTKCLITQSVEQFAIRADRGGLRRTQCRACHSASQSIRYAANPEKAKAYAYAWQLANRERVLANVSRYQRDNPDKRVIINHRRRARMRGGPQMTSTTLAARMAYFGNRCWMCRGPFEVIDHVKPISRGGPNILANLRPACKSCNGRKWANWHGPHELARFIKT